MKIIDILNKKANGTLEEGFKFIFMDTKYIFKNEMINNTEDENIGFEWDLELHLNEEVKVIEETKEIEELFSNTIGGSWQCRDDFALKNREKINELVRAVNKLNRESEEK